MADPTFTEYKAQKKAEEAEESRTTYAEQALGRLQAALPIVGRTVVSLSGDDETTTVHFDDGSRVTFSSHSDGYLCTEFSKP